MGGDDKVMAWLLGSVVPIVLGVVYASMRGAWAAFTNRGRDPKRGTWAEGLALAVQSLLYGSLLGVIVVELMKLLR